MINVLVGSMRSGTTWLMSLLGSHPEIKTFFEPFHAQQMKEYLPVNNLEEYLEKVQDISWVKKYRSSGNISLIKTITPTRFPHNAIDLEDLPYKKIIISRDALEVISSRVRLFKERDYLATDDDLKRLYREWKEDRRYLSNFYGHRLTYFELCQDPIKELKKCFEFLELDWSDKVSDFLRETRSRHEEDNYSVFKNKKSENILPKWFVEYVNSF
jgi:hypothetical protein